MAGAFLAGRGGASSSLFSLKVVHVIQRNKELDVCKKKKNQVAKA
jgi:hypothetical protein